MRRRLELLGRRCFRVWVQRIATANQAGNAAPAQAGSAVGPPAPAQAGSASGPQALAEHWNGSSWSTVPVAEPSNTMDSLLYNATCVTQSDCWAVGGQDLAPPPPNPTGPTGPAAPAPVRVAVSTAAPTKIPLPPAPTKAAPSGAAALVEHWNGTDWSMASLPSTSGYLYSVACPSASDCWAVGSNLDSNDDPLNSYVLHWNGSSWTNAVIPASGQAYDELNSVTCTSATNCWAVGTAAANPISDELYPNVFPNVQGAETYFLHWNGSSWSGSATTDPSSPTGVYLSGVTCVNPSECWAVGTTVDQNGDPQNVLFERWNGSSWALSPAGSPGVDAQLSNVSCVSATDCWAAGTVGSFKRPILKQAALGPNVTPPVPFVERWDGGNWWVESTPYVTSDSLLYGMACVHGAQCFATGGATTNDSGSLMQPLVEETGELSVDGQGFYAAGADGGVFNFGDAGFYGSMGGTHLNAPVIGIAATPDRKGYWEVASDGGVFAFGDARLLRVDGRSAPERPHRGHRLHPDGSGYWEVAADGGVFAFGDAGFYGSMGGVHLDAPIVGMAPTPDGGGYWEVAADGGVFAFGDAGFYGSMGGTRLDAPMVGIASTPDGDGYWEVAADGGVFAFGDADFNGSTADDHALRPGGRHQHDSPDGRGYWLVAAGGAVYNTVTPTGSGSLSASGSRPHHLAEQPGVVGRRPRAPVRRPPSPGCARRRPNRDR